MFGKLLPPRGCQDVLAGMAWAYQRAQGVVDTLVTRRALPECIGQRSHRPMHSVYYNAPWVEAFKEMLSPKDVRLIVQVLEGRVIASERAALTGQERELSPADAGVQLVLPLLDEYGMIEWTWRKQLPNNDRRKTHEASRIRW